MPFWPLPFLLLLLAACASLQEPRSSAQRDWTVMGTTFEITIYRDKAEADHLQTDMDAAFTIVTSIDEEMSLYKDTSELVAFNRRSHSSGRAISNSLYEVLSASLYYGALSDGAFDITVQPLVDLWGFYRVQGAAIPPHDEITKVLNRVGMDRFSLDAETRVATLQPGSSVDLGAIAKGYAVDRVVDDLQQRGVSAALVNLGGMVRVFGQPEDKDHWTIGVQHPRKNRLIGEIQLTQGAVATSGDYDRYFEFEGKRYSHLLDPRTGYPAQNLPALTVVASTALAADALSTAAFVLGPEIGLTLLERCAAVEGVVVMQQTKQTEGKGLTRVSVTDGLNKSRVTAFEGYANTIVLDNGPQAPAVRTSDLDCTWRTEPR